MMRAFSLISSAAVLLSACAATPPQAAADLNAAFTVAAAAEAAYAAQPNVNLKSVAQMRELLTAAQAAMLSWTNSPAPGQQAVLSAAVAALVAYEAGAKGA